MAVPSFPFLTLINDQKLRSDGNDLRLLDEQGDQIPLRAENVLSDNGDEQLVFALDELPAKGRRLLWLYYGNPQASKPPALPSEQMPKPQSNVRVTVGAEESRPPPLPPPIRGGIRVGVAESLQRWLSEHRLIEAEEAKGKGFSVQKLQGTAATAASGGAVLVFGGGEGGEASVEVDVDGGEYAFWLRYLPVPGDSPPTSHLAFAVEQGGKIVVHGAADLKVEGMPKLRWTRLQAQVASGKAKLVVQAENTRAVLDCFVVTKDQNYYPDFRDFQGFVWARWRINEPTDFRYWTKVHNEINPYAPSFQLTGSVGYFGLHPNVEQLPRTGDEDLLKATQYSPWVPLPTSGAAQWHSVFLFYPGSQVPQFPNFPFSIRLEFANRPSPSRIFHVVQEPVELGPAWAAQPQYAVVAVRMPTETTLSGLKQLESFTEWAKRRLRMVESLKLDEPPRLTKLLVGTWAHLGTRLGGGYVRKERAQIDFRIFEALGINMVSGSGVHDTLFAELAKEHGIINTTWTAWAGNWAYTSEAYSKQYDYKESETPEQRWRRVFDDFYRRQAEAGKKNAPFAFSIATHINLGDEIHPATNADEIRKTPQLLAYFRDWLKRQGLTPLMVGAKSWEEVEPVDNRRQLTSQVGTIEYARLFYHTRRFIDHYTSLFYRCATEAVKKYFPNARLIAVNYQAGPMQFGFIGNDNDMDKGVLDIFEFSRQRAFEGVMMEDWVYGWDLGIGRICLGAEIMRAAARKHNLPLASYLIGGEAIRAKFYAYLMHGIKENGLYLYGPVSNIGPAWGESEEALAETAEVTRQVKKFEELIADAKLRPTKAALLIATTSDIMQVKGLYFCPERQHLYLALKHSYVPVDVLCEQEIVEDNALKNYSLLFVTDPQVRVDVQRRIADWVRRGGRLWACVGAANWDEYNQPSAILNPVFGVKKREMVTQEDWLAFSQPFYSAAVSKFAYKPLGTLKASSPLFGGEVEIMVWGAKLDCMPTTAKVLGTYDDGKPAVLLNRHGQGEAMLVGALVGEAYARLHYPDGGIKKGWAFELGTQARRLAAGLVNRTGIQRPVLLSVPGVYTSVMDSPKGVVVFLNNASGQPLDSVTVRIRGAAKVTSVESARQGRLDYQSGANEIVVQLPLPNADIIALRR